jgi:hypothetical protein
LPAAGIVRYVRQRTYLLRDDAYHRLRIETLNSIQTAKSSKSADIENERLDSMLYTIAVVLLILWLLGLVTSYTLGGFIHILLVVAVVMILINIISGRRAL